MGPQVQVGTAHTAEGGMCILLTVVETNGLGDDESNPWWNLMDGAVTWKAYYSCCAGGLGRR